jgi:single-strand DNA-binding protein
MIIVTVAGNAGKDAEYKTTQGGTELCAFSVAGTVGYGDNKQTLWFDVTKWGKGAEGLSRCILKGTKVTVSGELSEREHDGKKYLQIRADHVALQGERSAGQQSGHRNQNGAGTRDDIGRDRPPFNDQLDDDVPF